MSLIIDTKSYLSLTLFSKLFFAMAVFNIDLPTASGYAVKTAYFVGNVLTYNLHSTAPQCCNLRLSLYFHLETDVNWSDRDTARITYDILIVFSTFSTLLECINVKPEANQQSRVCKWATAWTIELKHYLNIAIAIC